MKFNQFVFLGVTSLSLVGSFLFCPKLMAKVSAQTEEQVSVIKEDGYFQTDFSKEKGNWQDVKGTSNSELHGSQLMISNTTQGASIESVTLLQDSPLRRSGEVELNFLYEGQKNFGIIFRGSDRDTGTWQSFAYNGEGDWQLGQPGGKWLSAIKGPTLEYGQTYRFLVSYEGKSIRAFLNGVEFYYNETVAYPDDKGTIDGDWEGKIGIRLFGDRIKLKVNSLTSADVGVIPLEGGEPNPVEKEAFIALQKRWKQNLVGDFEQSTEWSDDEDIQAYVSKLSAESQELYGQLDRNPNRANLWPKKASDTESANLTTQFKQIFTLAKAYGTKGTSLYQDPTLLKDIIESLDYMVIEKKFDGNKYHGNWWDWQIGVPQEFVNTMMIIYDQLSEETTARYTQALSKYVPDPYRQLYGKPQGILTDLAFIPNFKTSGANRTDLALTVLGLGILENNGGKIKTAVNGIVDVFDIVSKGDGFYQDGSFIQHNDIPYTGSYGNVLIKGVGKILSIVGDSDWQLEEQVLNSFVENVNNAFIPLIFNGEMMPMVNGRSISRAPGVNKTGFGSATMYNLLMVSEFAQEPYRSKLRESVKYWVLENPTYYFRNTRDFNDLLMTKRILEDSTVAGLDKPFVGSRVYGAMDRYAYGGKNFSLGISLYSKRVSAFEAGNNENKRGWHTSDGMVYLFNQDSQFGPEYWPTVDPYRLPGTTVDTIKLADETSAFKSVRSPESHVGGVSNGQEAVMGMALNKAGTTNNGAAVAMDLKAQKSWFVIDDQVIALGSKINGSSVSSIETIVDNRLLDKESDYQLLLNQEKISGKQSLRLTNNDWLLLEANQAHQNIGYYFPEGQEVEVSEESRTGKYSDINSAFVNDIIYQGDYQKILINHGKKAENDHYAYVLVPNATRESLAHYVADKPIKILANTSDIQAVRHQGTGVTGVNIWAKSGGEIAGVKTDKPATILMTEKDHKLTVSIANPSQTAEDIQVSLTAGYRAIISSDESVLRNQDGSFTIRTANSAGGTHQFEVELEQESPEITDLAVTVTDLVVLKKGKTIPLEVQVTPLEATPVLQWEVEKSDIASVSPSGELKALKKGTTRITVTAENGVKASFVLRVTV